MVLIKENGGLVRDLFTNIVNTFPKTPVQSVKTTTLFPFEPLRNNPNAVQSNTQYSLFGKFIIASRDSATATSVDELFSLTSKTWPALFYSDPTALVFVFNSLTNAQLQASTGHTDSWFVGEEIFGNGAVGAYSRQVSPAPAIIRTTPTLIIEAQPTSALAVNYSIAQRIAPFSFVFSCSFSCSQEFDLGAAPAEFLAIVPGAPGLDGLQLSLIHKNSVLVVYNSIAAVAQIVPGRINTLTIAAFDLHTNVPKIQVFCNGLQSFTTGFNTLDDFSSAQVLTGSLRLSPVPVCAITYTDICLLVSADTSNIARLKRLTQASSLQEYFSIDGPVFQPNNLRTLLQTSSSLLYFTPNSAPFALDLSGSVLIPDGQFFTSSWTATSNALDLRVVFYVSALPPVQQTCVVFSTGLFQLKATTNPADSTQLALSLWHNGIQAASALNLQDITDAVDARIGLSFAPSANPKLCSSQFSVNANGLSSSWFFEDLSEPRTALVVGNIGSSGPLVLGLRSLQLILYNDE